MNIKNKCIICNHEINQIFKNNTKISVTSDNKPFLHIFTLMSCPNCKHIQKKVNKNYSKNINIIYKNYEAYHINNGNEDKKRSKNNKSTTRSSMIIKNISNSIKEKGKILDIGTGSGVFLKEFSKNHSWKLYAQDVNDGHKAELKSMPDFRKFYKKNEWTKHKFDIISAIHVFEHMYNIHSFLKDVKFSLKNNGFLLLQVPNIAENIFDVFTYDHISHFYPKSIKNILEQHFDYVYFPKNQISKEITILASMKKISKQRNKETKKQRNKETKKRTDNKI